MATARTDPDARDQEVLRANRELAAYFRGRRTEREARAALKIIKAFVRDRQHVPADKRRPLPGMKAAAAPPRKARKQRARKATQETEDTGSRAGTEKRSEGIG